MPSGRIPSLNFEYVILSLLTSGAKHGYELYKELEAWPGLAEVWKLKQSMLYADLVKLEKLAYLDSMPPDLRYSPPRVNFRITEKGRTALEAWVTTPVQKPREIRPEFLTKLLVADKLGQEYVKGLLNQQKIKAQVWVESEIARENERATNEPQVEMILNFRSHWLKHVVDWLDACLALLDTDR
jgi:PadR family transcriptional regulator AphA